MEILIMLISMVLVFGIWIAIDTNKIERKEFEVESKKIPENLDGYKICFVTDLHIKTDKKCLADKAIELVNKENPNIVILGGDYIFRSIFKYRKEKKNGGVKVTHNEQYKIDRAWKKISKLKSKEGVYVILGNHDYWEPKEKTLEWIEKLGFHSLDNKAYWIEKDGQKIRLGGVSDISEDMSDLLPTTTKTDGEYTILVSHSPVIMTLPKEGLDKIDMLIAGHLHGGQINLFGKYAPLIPKRWRGNIIKGMDTINNITTIISSGIGTTFIPIRFCARPDYTVITLRSKNND